MTNSDNNFILNDTSRDSISQFVFNEIMLEIILENVFEIDRLEKKKISVCGACGFLGCRSFVTEASKDIYGKDLIQSLGEKCECAHCGNSLLCARYATHLEKCLLGLGRSARPKKGSLLE